MPVKDPHGQGELLTAAEVASRLPSTSAQTVLRWAKTGQIPFVELPGGRKFFYPEVVNHLLTPKLNAAASSAGSTSQSSESSGVTEVPGQGALWSVSSPEGDSGGGRVE